MRSAQFRTFILNQKGKRREERGRQISILKDAKVPRGGVQGFYNKAHQERKRKNKLLWLRR